MATTRILLRGRRWGQWGGERLGWGVSERKELGPGGGEIDEGRGIVFGSNCLLKG